MKEHALKYLFCPECHHDLEIRIDDYCNETKHITSGELICSTCKSKYPILNGVPCFSLTLSDSNIDLNRNNFADEWNYFTAKLDKKSIELAKEELESYFNPLIDFKDLKNKTVLDAGCGGGRLIYITATQSSTAEVIGVDLSNAVFTAFKNTKHLNNVTIIQADITKLPFKKSEIFDFIYSVGVLHHMPNPKAGFSSLVQNLKEGGQILAWVYGKEGNLLYINFADPIRKLFTSKLPFKVNLFLSFVMTSFLWILVWLVYFPVNLIFGKNISNKLLPMNEYLNYFRKRGFNDFWRTVFDKMVPTISFYISKEEFTDWFTSNNLDCEIKFRNGHSWTGLGKQKLKRYSTLKR